MAAQQQPSTVLSDAQVVRSGCTISSKAHSQGPRGTGTHAATWREPGSEDMVLHPSSGTYSCVAQNKLLSLSEHEASHVKHV